MMAACIFLIAILGIGQDRRVRADDNAHDIPKTMVVGQAHPIDDLRQNFPQ